MPSSSRNSGRPSARAQVAMKWTHICVALCLASLCCDTTEPDSSGSISLQCLDVTCTDAVLSIGAGREVIRPVVVTLLRDDVVLHRISLSGQDTLLLEQNLSPGTLYSYHAAFEVNPRIGATAAVRTLDTTTHDWVFETIQVGRYGELLDVTIVGRDSAYAAGEVYSTDSSGNPDPLLYNLVRWDGQDWDYLRVQFYVFCGSPGTFAPPTRAIFSFGQNDVLITSQGGGLARWTGSRQTGIACLAGDPPVGFRAMWGPDFNTIYIPGSGGVAQLLSGVLSRMSVEPLPVPLTDLFLRDITGSPDGSTVFSTARLPFEAVYLLRLNRQRVWELAVDVTSRQRITWPDSISGGIFSLWMSGPHFLFLATDRGHYLAPSWTRGNARLIGGVAPGLPLKLRGSAPNNVFSVGEFGAVQHFNGVSWRTFSELAVFGSYNSVDVRENFAIIVGDNAQRPIVVLGRRN